VEAKKKGGDIDMVKIGKLKDFRHAVKMLRDGGFEVTETNGELVKKALVNGVEAISIGKLRGNTWVFRYNPNFFAES
jgi:hypothetical protein